MTKLPPIDYKFYFLREEAEMEYIRLRVEEAKGWMSRLEDCILKSTSLEQRHNFVYATPTREAYFAVSNMLDIIHNDVLMRLEETRTQMRYLDDDGKTI